MDEFIVLTISTNGEPIAIRRSAIIGFNKGSTPGLQIWTSSDSNIPFCVVKESFDDVIKTLHGLEDKERPYENVFEPKDLEGR